MFPFLWALLFLGWTMYTVVLYRRTRAAHQDAKRLATKEADKRADAAWRRQVAWWVCSAIILLLILLFKKIKNNSSSLVLADESTILPEKEVIPITFGEVEHRENNSSSLVLADESTILPEKEVIPITFGEVEHRGIQSVQLIPKVAPLVPSRQIPTERTQLRKPDARKQLEQAIDPEAPWWKRFFALSTSSAKPSTTLAPAPPTKTLAQRIPRPTSSAKPSATLAPAPATKTKTLAQRIARQPLTSSTSTKSSATPAPTQNTWKIARTSQPRASNSKPRDARDTEMWNIWKEKNPYLNNRQTREFDFHGLRVQDALDRLEDVIRTKCSQGIHDVTLISGRGLHSAGGIPKIKPAFEQYFRTNRMRYRPVHQGGAFEVHLNCT